MKFQRMSLEYASSDQRGLELHLTQPKTLQCREHSRTATSTLLAADFLIACKAKANDVVRRDHCLRTNLSFSLRA
jgi:hypothetical protein